MLIVSSDEEHMIRNKAIVAHLIMDFKKKDTELNGL